jgi:hypothetical protein
LDNVHAGLVCSVELYPFEGGPFILTPGQLLGVSVSKSLRGGNPGTFTLQLAAGGPYGVESPTVWAEILTPMSFVLIGLGRGSDRAIVMAGIVTDIGETQTWHTSSQGNTGVSRGVTVQGADFSWFFSAFNFYALSFYGLTAGTAIGTALDFVPGTLASVLSQGAIGGNSMASSNPIVVGQTWYRIMAGANGIMNKTALPYQNNSRLGFGALIGQVWEAYPDVFIPYADYFMISEESWTAKFNNIFAFPWYEFFVTTAPVDAYKPAAGATTVAGTPLTMASLPGAAPVSPVVVARVNPVPSLNITPGLSFGPIDTARWNALPLRDFTLQSFSFLQSSISFSAADARNFYQLNPTGYSTITSTNSNNIPFAFQFIAAGDPASVQRYGFRPQIGTTRWLFDPQGNAAQNPGTQVQDTILALTGRMISWYHPAPLMASASVTLPLAPTILIGTRFRYAPFKSGEPWDFYIESVTHTYEFGGESGSSTTRLTLSRGLPAAVYADSGSGGVLQAVHTGNAMRQEGAYVTGLPAGSSVPLQVITTTAQAASLSAQLSSVFVTPQSGAS